MTVIGIDPGGTGALAISYGTSIAYALRFSTQNEQNTANEVRRILHAIEVDRIDLLNSTKNSWTDLQNLADRLPPKTVWAFMEHVHAMPHDSRRNANTFGSNTGFIRGVMRAFQVPIIFVEPQAWQREFNLGARYETKRLRKKAHLATARGLFPAAFNGLNLTASLELCDALLIAEYGRRHAEQELTHGRNKNQTVRPPGGILWGAADFINQL